MRLLDDAQLLFDRVLTARPGTPPQRIDLDALCCGGAHLSPTWTPTMCPPSTSSASQAQRATRPRPDAYRFATNYAVLFDGVDCKCLFYGGRYWDRTSGPCRVKRG